MKFHVVMAPLFGSANGQVTDEAIFGSNCWSFNRAGRFDYLQYSYILLHTSAVTMPKARIRWPEDQWPIIKAALKEFDSLPNGKRSDAFIKMRDELDALHPKDEKASFAILMTVGLQMF